MKMRFTHPIDKEIMALALPSMLALMAEPLMGIFDTMLIGNYGTKELAATAGISAILSMSLWLFNFLSTGTTSRIAIFFGSKNSSSIGPYMARVVKVSLFIGVALILIFAFLHKPIILYYGFSEQARPLAADYLLIRLIGLPFTLLLYAGIGFYRGIQNAVIPMISSITANAVNLFLDIVLIYGIEGVIPEMGIKGAAWATVIAQITGLIVILVHAQKMDLFRIFNFTWISKAADYTQLFQTSGHLFFRTLFLLAGFLIAGSSAARMGDVILASHEIAMKLWLLGSFTVDSFAVAGQALAGKNRGKDSNADLPVILIRHLLIWGVILGAIFALIYLVFSSPIISFFTNDIAVITTIQSIMYLLILMQIPSAITFVLDGVLIGIEETKYLMKMMLVAAFLFIVVSVLSLQLSWGITGIWTGLTLLIAWRFLTNLYPFKRFLFGEK